MSRLIARVLVMTILPVAMLMGGGMALQKLACRSTQSGKGLGMMFGYDAQRVANLWAPLRDSHERAEAERKFLKLDLLFPLFYGGALALSLLMGLESLGQPFNPAWCLVPVVGAVLSDWVENLVQLGQLERYLAEGTSGLQAGWIQIASAATMGKITLILGTYIVIVGMAMLLLFRER